MDARSCLIFLIFFGFVAFWGYKRFVKNADIDAEIPYKTRVRVYVLILLALLIALSFFCYFQVPTSFREALLSLTAATLLAVLITLLLPYRKKWYAIAIFTIALVAPALVFLLSRAQLSGETFVLGSLVVAVASAAVTLLIFLKMIGR